MSTSIDYSKLEGNAKRAQALRDIIKYLGWEKFVEIHLGLLKNGKPHFEAHRVWLSIAGIQGYPAQAWYEHLWGGGMTVWQRLFQYIERTRRWNAWNAKKQYPTIQDYYGITWWPNCKP